ncbi:hypothetical protein X743_00725 [Mesorhizobium sp. LNHC252B00]|nr:hypothetical protein X743_00725 [Mesorhizobium sp. LNHC252B00]
MLLLSATLRSIIIFESGRARLDRERTELAQIYVKRARGGLGASTCDELVARNGVAAHADE